MAADLIYADGLTAVLSKADAMVAESPEWLRDLRAKGLSTHRALGVPTPRNEEWKYTPLRPLAAQSLQPGEPGPAVFQRDLTSLSDSPNRIVLVNGRLDRNLTDFKTSPGLSITSMRDALASGLEAVKTHLGNIATIDQHTFAALNTALFEDGVVIELAAGAEVVDAIEVVHIASGDGQVFAPRLLILAGEGAKATIIERYLTDGDGQSLTVPVTEVVISKGSVIEHVRVQDEAETAFHIGLWEIKQEGDSEYRSTNVAFGGKLARTDQNIWFGGEHAVTRLDGVVVARGEQLIDNHTRLDHAVPNCNSFEIYKQVVDDKASVVFNGKIFVHQDAQKTDAVQTNQTLLMSPQASIDSKPQLEIFADDVKCTHGATVGQLEDTPLFYLRSRGIPLDRARAVLVYAFAAEVLELIAHETVRERLEARLYDKLGVGEGANG